MSRTLRTCGLLAGSALLVVAAHGQIAGAKYTKTAICSMCHRNLQPELVSGYPQTRHAQAMAVAGGENIVADFANAPFQRDRVAYVLGNGRAQQAYLDADLKVLPGKWSTADKAWLPFESVDGGVQCVGCHSTGYDPETRKWKELGVGCEMCHGPGSKHLGAVGNDQKQETIVRPAELTPQRQAMVCGRCHSQGKSQDGVHPYAVDFLPGEDLDAKFVQAEPTGPGLNQQFTDLERSPKHYENGVVCTTCHDPHGDTDQPHQLRAPLTELCLTCHAAAVKSLDEHTKAKGATAPDGATCATCHMPEGRHLFDKTVRR